LCTGKVELSFDNGNAALTVSVTFARTLAILVNELIVNALRHAFPEDRLGTISVSLNRVDGDILLDVKDDGIGLETMNSGHTGFGTDLIGMMVRQIDGHLVSDGTSGSCFTLKAPVPLSPARGMANVAPFTFA
jgi:two-component system, sensor histidine kinase PdtaS